jgi:hypothetical protein
MGFFSGSGASKQLRKARAAIMEQGNAGLGAINTGYDDATGRLTGLQSDLSPVWQQYLDYVQGGGGLGGLRDLQQEYYNYRGPSEADMAYDPYRSFMDDTTRRNTRMAQSARGIVGSSAGIGQEERALAGNAADAYRFRFGNDQNRLMNSFNMLGGIENTRYNQLAGLGGAYMGNVNNLANLDTGRAQQLAAMRQWMGSGIAGTRSQQAGIDNSFMGKFGQSMNALGQVMGLASGGIGLASGMQGLQAGAMNNQAMQHVMQSPRYMDMMGLGGAYGPMQSY